MKAMVLEKICSLVDIKEPLASEFLRIMSHDSLLRNDDETLAICRDWQKLSNDLVHAYQDQALKELKFEGKPLKFSKLLRLFKKREKEIQQPNKKINKFVMPEM